MKLRARWVRMTICTALAAAACRRAPHVAQPPPGPLFGSVTPLAMQRREPRSHGRPGDLVVRGTDGTSITVAAAEDAPGHPPLRGAILDLGVAATDQDSPDPIVTLRTSWIDAAHHAHVLLAHSVVAVRCDHASAGVRATGIADGVQLETVICPRPHGDFNVVTRALSSLPAGAVLGDELDVGASAVLVDRMGEDWADTATTRFVAAHEGGIAFAIEAPRIEVTRVDPRLSAEVSPESIQLRYGRSAIVRTMHVVAGDALDAVARVSTATRTVDLSAGVTRAIGFDVLDGAHHVIARGAFPPTDQRQLRIPPDFGTAVVFRDIYGVSATVPQPFPGQGSSGRGMIACPTIERGAVRFAYADERGQPLAVHVLFKGLAGTRDPAPRVQTRGYAEGRSIYLLDGAGEIGLAPGRYHLTASHGPTHTLAEHTITVGCEETQVVAGTLRRVIDTSQWIAADLHLHASPSPDSRVTLAERVAALVCEGVDFAVATDHNHVTDYAPTVQTLGLQERLATAMGDEVTTFGRLWGHFIAFPLPLRSASESGVTPYFDVTPARIFAAARERGAQVLQVNHARMRPAMGYFDFARLEPTTGEAGPEFATDFNAVEVFNGLYIEHPEQVRAALRDVIALARRGMRVAATGNSDSHRLLFQEAGYPRTYVRGASQPIGMRAAAVTAGLLHGATTVSSGPFVEIGIAGEGPGAIVRAGPGGALRVHVRVSAPAWVPVEHVEVWVDDRVAQSFELSDPPRDGIRFERDVDLVVVADAVVLAWAESRSPLPDVLPLAHALGIGFTGPMYIDFDGDGAARVPPSI